MTTTMYLMLSGVVGVVAGYFFRYADTANFYGSRVSGDAEVKKRTYANILKANPHLREDQISTEAYKTGMKNALTPPFVKWGGRLIVSTVLVLLIYGFWQFRWYQALIALGIVLGATVLFKGLFNVLLHGHWEAGIIKHLEKQGQSLRKGSDSNENTQLLLARMTAVMKENWESYDHFVKTGQLKP